MRRRQPEDLHGSGPVPRAGRLQSGERRLLPSPAKPDGSACKDGVACTQSETCVTGACQDTNDRPTVLNLPVQDMGSLGLIQSFATDTNSSGIVVGWSSTDDWQNHAWSFSGSGPLVNLAAQLGLGAPSSAEAVNDANTIVGFQTLDGVSRIFRHGPAGFQQFDPFGDGSAVLNQERVLHAGPFVRGAFPTDINNVGDFVGFYTLGGKFRGFRHLEGAEEIEDVETLVANGTTFMEGISETGTAVGSSTIGEDPSLGTRAVLYEDEIVGLRDLNSLMAPESRRAAGSWPLPARSAATTSWARASWAGTAWPVPSACTDRQVWSMTFRTAGWSAARGK